MDRSRPKRSYYWASRVVAAAVVLLPLSIHKTDFRAGFGRGLAVAASKSSPAYAAFEDLNQRYISQEIQFPRQMETLSAGRKFELHHMAQSSTVRTVAMRGLVVRSRNEFTPQPFYVAGETRLRDHRGQLLPLQHRKQVLAAELADEAQNIKDVAAPAVVARRLVREELQAPIIKDKRVIRSATGTPIVIARTETPPPPAPEAPEPIEPTYTAAFMASVNSVQPAPEQMRPLWLNGQIEMTGGLAFIGSNETTLVVKRVVDGTIQEKGRIWVNEGRFEIHVKSASGHLVAELLARTGRVLGRGEVNLLQLKDVPTHDNRIYDIRIALRPTTEGAAMRAISAYSHGNQNLPVREARVEIQNFTGPQKVNDEGYISEPALDSTSSFVARASAPKHWSTVVVGQAEHPQDIRLFANTMIEALISLATDNGTDRREAHLESVVWGQIRHDGKPVEGASVEMAGSYRAIYFNEYHLPDAKLSSTSANGLFAFIKVKRGVQAVRVLHGRRVYPAQVFPTEDKHVSYVQLDLEERVVTQFKVMDLMNMSQAIEARVRLVGTEEIVPIREKGFIQYANGANPFMVEAEAGVEYEVSRVTLTGRPQNVVMPLIRRDWLMGLMQKNNILALPGRGITVGFVDHVEYDIELTGYAPNEKMQVVYFDAQGNQVDKKSGVAGGGFVVFNSPVGLQTLYVHSLQSKDAYAQVVVAEPEYVNVMTWSGR